MTEQEILAALDAHDAFLAEKYKKWKIRYDKPAKTKQPKKPIRCEACGQLLPRAIFTILEALPKPKK